MATIKTISRWNQWQPSREQVADVIDLYKRGKGTPYISERFGVSVNPIRRILEENNISIRKRSDAMRLVEYKYTKAQLRHAVSLYSSGLSSREISRQLGMDKSYVLDIVREADKDAVRSMSDSQRLPLYNERAFATITDESAYWAGFLMADGNVHKNVINLGLATRDRDHVVAFKDFVGSRCSIRDMRQMHNGRESFFTTIAFNSPAMTNDLAKYGVIEAKSLIAKAAGGMETSVDFWRGMIDGDGSVSIVKSGGKRYPRISFASGSLVLVKQYREWAATVVAKYNNIWSGDNIHQYSFTGSPATAMVYKLYSRDTISLERKRKVAKEIIHDCA